MEIFFLILAAIISIGLSIYSFIYYSNQDSNLFEKEIKRKFKTSQVTITVHDNEINIGIGVLGPNNTGLSFSKKFTRKVEVLEKSGITKIYLVEITTNPFWGPEITHIKICKDSQ